MIAGNEKDERFKRRLIMVYDAVIVAGGKTDSISLKGGNKVFFPLEEVPLVVRVLRTLISTACIGKIIVVGDSKRLLEAVEEHLDGHLKEEKIILVEQEETIFENAWSGFLNSLPEYRDNSLDKEELFTKYSEKQVLFLPADIPLITSKEIKYFISKCEVEKFDFFAGLTPLETILPFAPKGELPGISMTCLHLKEGLFRISNLFLARPYELKGYAGINEMYEYRYQKKFFNISGLFFQLLIRPNFLRMVRHFIVLQSALFLSNAEMKRFSDFIRRFFCAPMNVITKDLSLLMRTKVSTVEIPFGGSAVDIDNERDLETMGKMFSHWQKKIKTSV